MTVEEAERLDHFFCESCSVEGQKQLQNSHSATRLADTKVYFSPLLFDGMRMSLFSALNTI